MIAPLLLSLLSSLSFLFFFVPLECQKMSNSVLLSFSLCFRFLAFLFLHCAGFPYATGMDGSGSFASHDGFSHAGICSGRRYSTLFFFFCLVFFVLRRYFPTNNLKEKSRCHYARHFPPFKLMDIGIDSTAPFFVRKRYT